jgi:DNA-binding transcriptional LysR family regulator
MLENFRLRVFRAVAESLNFRKAGEKLYLTQPAVTLQVKALEEEIGAKLFERNASGVTLTAAGEILYQYANRLCAIAEEAENELAHLKGQASGELVLGASTTIAQYVLPPLLARFAKLFPAIQLQVFSQNTEGVAEGVASGRFALGLIEGPALRRDLKVKVWFDDELLLTVPATHEWAGLSGIAPEKLLTVPLVMREPGSGSRHVVEKGLQEAGLRLRSLRIAMELDSTEAILSCIEAGLGVGIVSTWAVARRLSAGSLATLRIGDKPMIRHFSFALPQGPYEENSAADRMVRFLESAVPLQANGLEDPVNRRAKRSSLSNR